ncbi:MAG: HAD family phosphatase [Allomuricauda sp.]
MIKNIILDFGDVFINLDKPATARAMQRFGFNGITPELDGIFRTYEMGQIDSPAFLAQVSSHFPKASHHDLVTAWNAILLDFPEQRLHFLEMLAQEKRYRLFLLSNTNDLHIEAVQQQMGLDRYLRFKNAFEVFYLSHEMGMRKPDQEIFEFVLHQNALKASETLFVDDTLENTSVAASLGIRVWHLRVGKEDITQLKLHL